MQARHNAQPQTARQQQVCAAPQFPVLGCKRLFQKSFLKHLTLESPAAIRSSINLSSKHSSQQYAVRSSGFHQSFTIRNSRHRTLRLQPWIPIHLRQKVCTFNCASSLPSEGAPDSQWWLQTLFNQKKRRNKQLAQQSRRRCHHRHWSCI